MKKLLFVVLLVFSFSLISIKANDEPAGDYNVVSTEEMPIEEVPVEIPAPGFFENIVNGFLEFVVSEEFTQVMTGLSTLVLALYPYLRRFIKIKNADKDDRQSKELKKWQEKAKAERKEKLEYARMVKETNAFTKAINEALKLGFDKSNLKTDVKDKIMSTLKVAPIEDIEGPEIDELEEVNELKTEKVEIVEEKPIKVETGW